MVPPPHDDPSGRMPREECLVCCPSEIKDLRKVSITEGIRLPRTQGLAALSKRSCPNDSAERIPVPEASEPEPRLENSVAAERASPCGLPVSPVPEQAGLR